MTVVIWHEQKSSAEAELQPSPSHPSQNPPVRFPAQPKRAVDQSAGADVEASGVNKWLFSGFAACFSEAGGERAACARPPSSRLLLS